MWAGGHFSLFIITKILRKQFKKFHQYNNEMLQNPCGTNFHAIKFYNTFKKAYGRKQESDQLCLAYIKTPFLRNHEVARTEPTAPGSSIKYDHVRF